jgi:hypothetical protein
MDNYFLEVYEAKYYFVWKCLSYVAWDNRALLSTGILCNFPLYLTTSPVRRAHTSTVTKKLTLASRWAILSNKILLELIDFTRPCAAQIGIDHQIPGNFLQFNQGAIQICDRLPRMNKDLLFLQLQSGLSQSSWTISMAWFLHPLILFVVNWWSDTPDLQPYENDEAYCEACCTGSSSIFVPAGSCHIMPINSHEDDAAFSLHHSEAPRSIHCPLPA